MKFHQQLAFCVVMASMAAPALAADTDEEVGVARGAAEPSRFLPGILSAEAGQPLGLAFGWGGYDSATRNPLLGIAAEVRLGSRVVLGAGVIYSAGTEQKEAAAHPNVHARVQILDQASHGIDLGIGVAYHQDRFIDEEGLLQAGVSLGLHDRMSSLLVNAVYGMDAEADDHQGEVRVVALRRLVSELHAGIDGRVRWLLNSTDQLRVEHGTPKLECAVAPALTYAMGSVTVMAEAGWSCVNVVEFQSGVFALGGLGAAF